MIKKYILPVFAILLLLSACETYPDWENYVDYSTVYPVVGEYYVTDYHEDGTVLTYENSDGETIETRPYSLYIYNKSYNPTGDSIWLDNKIGHPTTSTDVFPYRYKIKLSADTTNLTFDCEKVGSVTGYALNPTSSANMVTISESFIIDYDPGDITSAEPDSIYFKCEYFDSDGQLLETIITKGHRKTGWENPNNDDDM